MMLLFLWRELFGDRAPLRTSDVDTPISFRNDKEVGRIYSLFVTMRLSSNLYLLPAAGMALHSSAYVPHLHYQRFQQKISREINFQTDSSLHYTNGDADGSEGLVDISFVQKQDVSELVGMGPEFEEKDPSKGIARMALFLVDRLSSFIHGSDEKERGFASSMKPLEGCFDTMKGNDLKINDDIERVDSRMSLATKCVESEGKVADGHPEPTTNLIANGCRNFYSTNDWGGLKSEPVSSTSKEVSFHNRRVDSRMSPATKYVESERKVADGHPEPTTNLIANGCRNFYSTNDWGGLTSELVSSTSKEVPFHSRPVDQDSRALPYFATAVAPTYEVLSGENTEFQEETRDQSLNIDWKDFTGDVLRSFMANRGTVVAFLETTGSITFQTVSNMAREYAASHQTRQARAFIPRPPRTPPSNDCFDVQNAMLLDAEVDEHETMKHVHSFAGTPSGRVTTTAQVVGSGLDMTEIDEVLSEVESALQIAEAAIH